ncbi:MAG: tRNA (adenosine(37)-N6)-threonylcarbamoyltransferase complex dimerization subunit type 1 TsaB [Candidatus Bipolaricaulota bacterium]|nr:tRNA (adenosine(37)-N6)-threonylcarbamoyltransferase complex dimerization subunit type 1 TsaB [Candidatus Bipolaricaulota bacterium]
MDTSVSLGGAALWRDGEGVAEMMMESPLSHAEELLPLILRLLEQCSLERDEIDLVSVNVGPGSFTGLRIGLATTKGLCQALGIPLVGIGGMFAYRARLDAKERVCVLLRNRRDLLYARWFVGMKPQDETLVLTGAGVWDRLVSERKDVTIVGDGALVVRDLLGEAPWVRLASAEMYVSSPMWIARLGEEGEQKDQLYDLEPAYVEPILFKTNNTKKMR